MLTTDEFGCKTHTTRLLITRLRSCSYKLGSCEVQSTEDSLIPVSTPGPATHQEQLEKPNSITSQHASDMQLSSESRLQQRIRQLEADMTEASVCCSMSGLYKRPLTGAFMQVQNMLLLHEERLDNIDRPS